MVDDESMEGRCRHERGGMMRGWEDDEGMKGWEDDEGMVG